MRFHTQTAGVSLTAQQPLNNIVRTTIEALAAVLGGTQSLHTNSYDEALALPTEEAVRVALRTQQVIAHETGVASTADPLGGSYFVEALTDEMERRCYEYFAKIEQLGGMVEAVKRNYPQREIADAAFELQQEIDSGERVVVGVNRFVQQDEEPIPTLRVDPALERKQLDRLQSARARRDGAAVERTLADLREAAAHERRNLMEPLLAVRPRERLRGRDHRVPAAGLRRLHRDAGLLAPAAQRRRGAVAAAALVGAAVADARGDPVGGRDQVRAERVDQVREHDRLAVRGHPNRGDRLAGVRAQRRGDRVEALGVLLVVHGQAILANLCELGAQGALGPDRVRPVALELQLDERLALSPLRQIRQQQLAGGGAVGRQPRARGDAGVGLVQAATRAAQALEQQDLRAVEDGKADGEPRTLAEVLEVRAGVLAQTHATHRREPEIGDAQPQAVLATGTLAQVSKRGERDHVAVGRAATHPQLLRDVDDPQHRVLGIEAAEDRQTPLQRLREARFFEHRSRERPRPVGHRRLVTHAGHGSLWIVTVSNSIRPEG